MTPDLLVEFKHDLEQEEGRVRHMYLDSASPAWVTCGIGHRLATLKDAQEVAFDPHWAVEGDYRRVLQAKPGMAAHLYEPLCASRLTDATIDYLLDQDVQVKVKEVRTMLRAYDAWPGTVQQAVLDMAFNLGTGRMIMTFPKFMQALRAGDWSGCAAECHRQGVADARNERTRQRFLAALK